MEKNEKDEKCCVQKYVIASIEKLLFIINPKKKKNVECINIFEELENN